jgi:predicted metallopeptidase
MTIQYSRAPDLERLAQDIVLHLEMRHVRMDRFACVRSRGSRATRTLARLHSIPKIWKEALGIEPCYTIEVISEKFDRLDQEDKEKTIIHELLHIPRGFRGGFRHHRDYVTSLRVNRLHSLLMKKRRNTARLVDDRN